MYLVSTALEEEQLHNFKNEKLINNRKWSHKNNFNTRVSSLGIRLALPPLEKENQANFKLGLNDRDGSSE